MSATSRALKRMVVGRAMRSDRLDETLLPKRVALPVFASDALSSVAYAPDEILLTLGLAGAAFATVHSWQIGLAVATVMIVVVMSYRQNVHAYPSGGGDYEVAGTNLGPRAGLAVGAALLVDYVLTVAVSISSGVANAAGAMPFLRGHEVATALALILVLTAINLRGVRESGTAFALPTYAFMFGVLAMGVFGMVQLATGQLGQAASAELELAPHGAYADMSNAVMVFLLLRAFSSGCAALTGVEAISNGVPAFRPPKSKNAAATLTWMGAVAITMLVTIVGLARQTGVKIAEHPSTQLLRDGVPVGEDYVQETVITQLSHTIFADLPVVSVGLSVVTGFILVLAANTAFNGFPVLASVLSRDGFLPRQMHTRGDRLAFSNGIVMLGGAAAVLVAIYDAKVTALIQLYIVGVFVSFTLSQIGMTRHWNRILRTSPPREQASRARRSRVINIVGAVMSGTVLIIVLMTKFLHGAGLAILAMGFLWVLMVGVRRHYDKVARELALSEDPSDLTMLPSRVHAIVLVAKVHKATMRAVSYARATRPSTLEAVTVEVDAESTRDLVLEWDRRGVPVPLKVLESPYREITRPVVEYVRRIRRASPRDMVVVYVPEYVVGHWYEQILHNQSALRLKTALLFNAGVIVASVPWQLESSAEVDPLDDEEIVAHSTATRVRP